jgi:NitT/TauT family transport system substrate-binding protein
MNVLAHKFAFFLLMLEMIAGLSACTPATPAPPSLTPVTVQLSWTHQAQFAGFYAADQNGDYTAEGLAVTFVQGGPDVQTLTSVMDQSAQFAVAAGDQLLLWRANGRPVRAIATLYCRTPRVYMALVDSGITRPQDFVGKSIAINRNGRPLLDAMMLNLTLQFLQEIYQQ